MGEIIRRTQRERPSEAAPIVEWALYYAEIGIKVFPIKPRTKDSYYPDYEHRGKPTKKYPIGTPYSWSAQATTDTEQVRKMFKKYPDANIGGVTGQGCYVVDIDIRTDGNGFDYIHKWEKENILPKKLNISTWTSITGSGSQQLFYFLSPELVKRAKDNAIDLAGDAGMIEQDSHVDSRGDGRYVVLPPSVHPNGERYRWADCKSPSDIPIADFDKTVEFLFTHKGNKKKGRRNRLNHELTSGEKVPKGSRRAYMLSRVGELVNKMIDIADDSTIVAAAMRIAHNDLDTTEPLDSGWDGLERDIESMVYDFRNAILKEREEGTGIDWKYSVRAWYMEHPTETLPDPVNWEEVKAAGERRKNNEVIVSEQPNNEDGKACLPAFHITKKGSVINDVRNAKIFLDFILQGNIRYNSFTNRIDIYGAVPWETDNQSIRPWNDADTSNALMLANEYSLRSKNNLIDAICIVANENKYHPIKQYLESLKYSGDGYIRKLAVEYMGCEDTEYTFECMKLLLLAMVQRVYFPGCKYDYVLIFVGPQGSYKSTFWKTLARDDEWFSDSIDSFSDRKKLGELIQGKWLVELGEMSAFKKSEIESIKAAVTSQCDSYREAFMRFRSDFPRTTVFVGTTNNKTFLRDSTGNRRFLVLPINNERRTKDLFNSVTRDQDFENALAEALQIFREATKNGKPMPLVLPKSVLAEAQERQNNANAYEEWTGTIEPWLEDAVKEKNKKYTCGLDVWCNCFHRDQASFTSKEAKRINEILDSLPEWERSSSVRVKEENSEGRAYFDYHGRGYKYVGDLPD